MARQLPALAAAADAVHVGLAPRQLVELEHNVNTHVSRRRLPGPDILGPPCHDEICRFGFTSKHSAASPPVKVTGSPAPALPGPRLACAMQCLDAVHHP